MLVKMFAAVMITLFLTFGQYGSSETVTAPSLEFYPVPSEGTHGSKIIWYGHAKGPNYEHWTHKLDELLEVYKAAGPGQNRTICDYDHLPSSGQVCDENVRTWAPCIKENDYGYPRHKPCVFLKLNKIPGWVPDFYGENDTLPENMPDNLKQHIHSVKASDPKKLNSVWVSCDGVSPADRENVGGIQYLPSGRQGFPGFFFPYNNSDDYLSPLVAVHFRKPLQGILIDVECKAWAKNIIHDKEKQSGSTNFLLLLD